MLSPRQYYQGDGRHTLGTAGPLQDTSPPRSSVRPSAGGRSSDWGSHRASWELIWCGRRLVDAVWANPSRSAAVVIWQAAGATKALDEQMKKQHAHFAGLIAQSWIDCAGTRACFTEGTGTMHQRRAAVEGDATRVGTHPVELE